MMRAVLAALLIVAPTTAAASGIERVAGLQGCWSSTSGTRVIEEQWTAPGGGTRLESGRTTDRDTWSNTSLSSFANAAAASFIFALTVRHDV